MNLQQLEYIVAVDRLRHFGKAAEECFVTQPTLSMMIQKLEDEIGVIIFDRTKKPVSTTDEGRYIVEKAKDILVQVNEVQVFSKEIKNEVAGDLRIGIIPTLAPYLTPLFLPNLHQQYPDLKIHMMELLTSEILRRLKSNQLDLAIAATPLYEPGIIERFLFNESYFLYSSPDSEWSGDGKVKAVELDVSNVWLMSEGHCMRSQMQGICSRSEVASKEEIFKYEAGSIETLIHLVDRGKGMTIIPALSVPWLSQKQKKNVRSFIPPVPARTISLLHHISYNRAAVIHAVMAEIFKTLPQEKDESEKNILPIGKN